MLSQMPWQILRGETQLEIFANSRMLKIEPSIAQTPVERVILVLEFPGCHCRRHSLQRLGIESQRLAHFARRHAIAIGDHVGGHGRAALSITLIDVLDHALPLVAAGQIEIDVGPLTPLLGEKSFKQQLHADRDRKSEGYGKS